MTSFEPDRPFVAITEGWRCKAAERVAHDDEIDAVADRLDDGDGVVPPAGRVVLAGKIARQRVVSVLAQGGSYQVPVPGAPATTVDEHERRHVAQASAW